ncbi:BTAD domain-containing putative transcriptional regulator [Streptomyces longisporoflavus]|uniref:BTAD domain-containing putative transcriptional regulator n=1 Tax=Streptomyces longisporoflavus TaxID=28044 RepID=A0ABW7R3I7_9ACTN
MVMRTAMSADRFRDLGPSGAEQDSLTDVARAGSSKSAYRCTHPATYSVIAGLEAADGTLEELARCYRRRARERPAAVHGRRAASVIVPRLLTASGPGRYAEAAAEADVLAADHPLHENFHRLLMIALYRSGHPKAAAEVFTKFRRRLVNEFGMEPSPGLKRFYQQMISKGLQSGNLPTPSETDPAQRRP